MASGVIRVRRDASDTDRRAHERVRLRVPVLLDSRHSWQKCHATNVSLGGLALRTAENLELGADVELYFELPNGVMIEAQARAVRAQGPLLGVRFDSLTPEQCHGLRAFITLSRQEDVAIRFAP
ncbi:MAG TPA: PilZ domain-containing protein [Polyangiaceae bacterium]|jgi:hypothetical protein